MRTEPLSFWSGGLRVRGLLRLPDGGTPPYPVIVHPPGWLGLAAQTGYERYHRMLTGAGYAVVAFDYRGYGESEGEPGWVLPDSQVEDIAAAVDHVENAAPMLDAQRIGIYGQGGVGGGNAIIAAAHDERIRCVVVQSVVADGRDWLRRMRSEHEWVAFLERVHADQLRRARQGDGELVDPRRELMVATPERATHSGKAATDERLVARFHLASAGALLRYRPIDHVHRIAPRGLLITLVEDDDVTPAEHAEALYARAGSPRRLVRLGNTTHYRSHVDHAALLEREIVGWFGQHCDVRDAAILHA